MFPSIIVPLITNLKYFFLGQNHANAHNPRKNYRVTKRVHDGNSEAVTDKIVL